MAISPTREKNYSGWYQSVITAADLAETASVRGCMTIKPDGYAIWERIVAELDQRLKATGHRNLYLPLLISLKDLERESAHIEGFAKECAVVTHHRVKLDARSKKLLPDENSQLEEPYVIRPTSEVLFGLSYAKWIESYRDLPLLYNQWCNVFRWEMRTRLFLRTAEFLWQEGHTAHETQSEAQQETLTILKLYQDFLENVLAIPVITGVKPIFERFPGAVETYCVEGLMQDGKALQLATSHFLGQNFSKPFNIQFINRDNQHDYVWTTSWGLSTRVMGGLIMTHSDDEGLILPPNIAPYQIVILPILRDNIANNNQVLERCEQLRNNLENNKNNNLRVLIDKRPIHGGEKLWQWVKKGVPICLEIGPRDLESYAVTLRIRDEINEKIVISQEKFLLEIKNMLNNLQNRLFNRAKKRLAKNYFHAENLKAFKEFFNSTTPPGFIEAFAINDEKITTHLKPLEATARVILSQESQGYCIFTGQSTKNKLLFAKAY